MFLDFIKRMSINYGNDTANHIIAVSFIFIQSYYYG